MSLLLDSPAAVVAALLITNSVFDDPTGSSPTWPLYVDFLPDDAGVADDAGALYDTAGVASERAMTAPSYEHAFFYGLQLRVRAQKQTDAWTRVVDATSFLEQVYQSTVTINARTYQIQSVNQTSTPLFLGVEEGPKRRVGFTVNFLATINPQ